MNWGNQKICRFSHGQVWTLEVGHRGRDGVMIIFRPGGHRIVPSGNETWPEKHQFIFHLWKLSYFYIILLGIFKCHWAMFDCWPTCYMFFFKESSNIALWILKIWDRPARIDDVPRGKWKIPINCCSLVPLIKHGNDMWNDGKNPSCSMESSSCSMDILI